MAEHLQGIAIGLPKQRMRLDLGASAAATQEKQAVKSNALEWLAEYISQSGQYFKKRGDGRGDRCVKGAGVASRTGARAC